MVGRAPRVILFEDNLDLRNLLEQFLSRKGYEVLAYEDPSSCRLNQSHDCQCTSNDICADIIITDIDMPNVSGLEFIDSQMSKGCKIQNVAVMSGAWTEEKRIQVGRLGFTVFQKPFPLTSLKEWLDTCVDNMDSKNLYDWFLEEKCINSNCRKA